MKAVDPEARCNYLPKQQSEVIKTEHVLGLVFSTSMEIVDLKVKRCRRSSGGIETKRGGRKTNGKLLQFYRAHFDSKKKNPVFTKS